MEKRKNRGIENAKRKKKGASVSDLAEQVAWCIAASFSLSLTHDNRCDENEKRKQKEMKVSECASRL
jgi:hypothetical protein